MCAPFGSPGSGKTVLLMMAQQWFEKMASGNASVYVTLNGDAILDQYFDVDAPIATRMASRLLHAACGTEPSLLRWTVEELRMMVGLPRSYQRGNIHEDWYSDPSVLAAVLRTRLGVAENRDLLIAFDELRKLRDVHIAPGQFSDVAVEGLKYLGRLTQASFKERKASGDGVIVVMASALSAFDPRNLETASNRRIYYLPLPPVKVGAYWRYMQDKPWVKELDDEGKTQVRAMLWQAQYNARFLGLTADVPSLDKMKSDNAKLSRMVANIEDFLHYCELYNTENKGNEPPVNPASLLRLLFWPQRRSVEENFTSAMIPALIGDSSGICIVIRGEAHDTVYMNPALCLSLCSILRRREMGGKAALGLAERPRKELLKMPAMPGDASRRDKVGKLYERIISLMMACRVALADPEEKPTICDLQPKDCTVHGKVCRETLLTHDDIRALCPMVAYSACDARVLIEEETQKPNEERM